MGITSRPVSRSGSRAARVIVVVHAFPLALGAALEGVDARVASSICLALCRLVATSRRCGAPTESTWRHKNRHKGGSLSMAVGQG